MTTYYINADTGNDSTGDGSITTPWLLLSKAHTEAASGDTIICQDSTATYTFATINFTKSLTIQGEQSDASGAVFDGGGATVLWKVTASNVSLIIQKITIQNIAVALNNALIGMGVTSGDSITIQLDNCIVHNITFSGTSTRPSVILGCSPGYYYGTSITWNCNNTLIYDINAENAADTAIFGSNRLTDNNCSVNINNCTIVVDSSTTPLSGLVCGGYNSAVPMNIINSIFADVNGGALSFIGTRAITPVVTYSDLYASSPTTGAGVITSDPLFVDPDNNNYYLRPSSPCFNTGILL